MALERYFKRPLEVEWAVDVEGRCHILQSRPLVLPQVAAPVFEESIAPCAGYRMLLHDTGASAYGGVGCGIVRVVEFNADMAEFPDAAVLVTHFTAP